MIPIPIIDAQIGNPKERVCCLIQQLASYEKLLALDIKKVFPGHYRPFDNAQAVIEQQMAKINYRKERCFKLIQQGCHQFYVVLEILPGRFYSPTLLVHRSPFLHLFYADAEIPDKES